VNFKNIMNLSYILQGNVVEWTATIECLCTWSWLGGWWSGHICWFTFILISTSNARSS